MFSSSSSSFLQYPIQLSPSRFSTNKQPSFTPSSVKFRPHKKTVAAYSTAETKRPLYFSNEMASASSLYEVLGIPMSASCHEIKAAYRRLARMCHPDVVAINQKETSANEFIKIHAAYSTLSDPDKRASYDREFYRHRRPYGSSSMAMASAVAGFSGYTSRKWETDQCW